MSCTLHWRPIADGRAIGDLRLRNAIEGEYGLPCMLDMNAIPFLRGLAAANIDGARRLIEIIDQHETVEMYKVC